MSAFHSILQEHFPYRFKFYLDNVNLSGITSPSTAAQPHLLSIDENNDVIKTMPIFDINTFKLADDTGTITFNKKPGDVTITLDPYYNTTYIDEIINDINTSIISLIDNVATNYYTIPQIDGTLLNYYTKSQIEAQRIWFHAIVSGRNMFFVDNLYPLKDPSEISKSKRNDARVFHITEDGIVFVKDQVSGPNKDTDVVIPLLTGLAGGAAGVIGGLFGRKLGIGGSAPGGKVPDPSISKKDFPELRLSD